MGAQPAGEPGAARTRVGRGLGIGICLVGALACLGAKAPWFSFSVLAVSAHIGGLNSHLDGRYALALGLVGVVLGVTVIVAADRVAVWWAAGVALLALGIGGDLMVSHEYVHLTHTVTKSGRASGLTPFAKYFDVHGAAAWGLWLTGGSFGALAVAGLLAVAAGLRYSRRSAPPSTGIAQPVRYDATGDKANAATLPNSAGSP